MNRSILNSSIAKISIDLGADSNLLVVWCFWIALGISASIGNLLLILTIWRTSALQTNSMITCSSQALASLLNGLCFAGVGLDALILITTGVNHRSDSTVSSWWNPLVCSICLFWTYHLTQLLTLALSCDRIFAVLLPHSYNSRFVRSDCLAVNIVVWTIPTIYASIFAYLKWSSSNDDLRNFRMNILSMENQDDGSDRIFPKIDRIVGLIVNSSTILINLCILLVFSRSKLYKNNNNGQHGTSSAKKAVTSTCSGPGAGGGGALQRSRSRTRMDLQIGTFKTVSALTMAHVFCWIFYGLLPSLIPARIVRNYEEAFALFEILLSAVFPLVYLCMSSTLWSACKGIFVGAIAGDRRHTSSRQTVAKRTSSNGIVENKASVMSTFSC